MNNTKKLSGIEKDRFFDAFFRLESGIDAPLAERLAKKSAAAFSSVRVRPENAGVALARFQDDAAPPRSAPQEFVETPTHQLEVSLDQDFDPYCFGLVPVLQREGRAGLVRKLVAVGNAAHMRQMARAQQVALDAKAKSSDVDVKQLAASIADATARKAADRRAAAG